MKIKRPFIISLVFFVMTGFTIGYSGNRSVARNDNKKSRKSHCKTTKPTSRGPLVIVDCGH